jgi:hypothetical protein
MPGRSLGILALAAGVACSPRSGPTGDGSGSGSGGAPAPTFTVFALAEVRGQIEPCGCTTDPLGDLSRTARLIGDTRAKGPTIVVDAGGLLYSRAPVPAHLVAQEELKADLLASVYKDKLAIAGLGVGKMDLAAGTDKVRLPREVANLTGDVIAREPPRLIDAGGAKVGVFGVAAADTVQGLAVGDPIAAGTAAIADLKKRGATVVVALIQAASKKDAIAILRGIGPGADIAVLGLGTMAPEPEDVSARAEEIDGTWVVIPGNRGQVVSRIDVTVRPGDKPLVDAVGPAAAAAEIAQLDVRIEALDEQLDAFAKDPSADPAFVATQKAERDQLAAERAALATSAWRRPAAGSYFTLEQVRITKKLACDATVDAAKTAYDRAAGEANVKAAAAMPVPPVPKGKPTYVGTEACSDCHGEQAEFWEKSKHAGAWETLEERGKQFDFDCIGCHVTGWDKPGGATLAVNEALRDVQCEVCHGPGSIHVDKEGAKGTIARAPAPELCAGQCHTKEHSDTFALEPYLRDIVGPGHGAERAKALGAGPTGHELRAAGLAKAGAALGEGCKK